MRVFVAVELDPRLRERLAGLRNDPALAGLPLRWVNPAHLHLTLRFLGEIAESRVFSVTEAVREASESRSPFRIRLAGVGSFPGWSRLRVPWTFLSPPQTLPVV